ncbi:MAG TPA: sigma-70 family RNA polymerase sigma factor [Polyangiaceae bacterium]
MPEFAELYSEYFSFVWSCTRRMGVAEDEIDDVVQEIFLVIHTRLRTLDQPSSLRSWIYGIARRTTSTYRRAKRAKLLSHEMLVSEPDFPYPQPPSPLELAEQSDDVRLLWMLLEQIDPEKREVFVLAELDEMTVPDIASAIEIPVNTAYSRLRAARQALEEALARHNARKGPRGRSCPT